MKQRCIIHADSFALRKRRILIYRFRQPGNATLLWTSREAAIEYLKNLQITRLQARHKGR